MEVRKVSDKKRVLAVDDEATNLSVIESALQDTYKVIAVNSGMRALKYVEKERPDMVLLDIYMQQMDGIETLRQIRAKENGADIPVIMLTSDHERSAVVESAKLGVCDYVLKPFEPKDLLSRIDAALKKAGKKMA